jgi:hypothetical protein
MGRGDGISRRQSLPPIFYNSIQSHSNTKADTARSLILRPKPLNLFRKALVVKKLENSLLLGRETIVEKNKFTNIRAG